MTGNPVDQRRCYRDQDPSKADYGESYLGDKERCTSDSRYNRWMFGWMLSLLADTLSIALWHCGQQLMCF